MKIEICVFGYPKSGTIWLCRLLADAICCPAAGYYGMRKNAKSHVQEGQNRKSQYRVWQGHYPSFILKRHLPVYSGLKKKTNGFI